LILQRQKNSWVIFSSKCTSSLKAVRLNGTIDVLGSLVVEDGIGVGLVDVENQVVGQMGGNQAVAGLAVENQIVPGPENLMVGSLAELKVKLVGGGGQVEAIGGLLLGMIGGLLMGMIGGLLLGMIGGLETIGGQKVLIHVRVLILTRGKGQHGMERLRSVLANRPTNQPSIPHIFQRELLLLIEREHIVFDPLTHISLLFYC